MPKKRLIFSLLYNDGYFVLSRNFRHQRIGDLSWLENNYNFRAVSRFIDELLILNVSRTDNWNWSDFLGAVESLASENFVPISVGGFGADVERGAELLRTGADKLIVNSALFTDQLFVERLVGRFGRQCVVGSIDVGVNSTGHSQVFINKGQNALPGTPARNLASINPASVGELLVRSIVRDGTGQGLDLDLLEMIPRNLIDVPVLLAGGVGKPSHLIEGLLRSDVAGVSTGNLLNFIGPGLEDARQACLQEGVDLAIWRQLD